MSPVRIQEYEVANFKTIATKSALKKALKMTAQKIIPDPWTKEERPFNLYTSLPGLPRLLTSVNGSISKKSMRIYYDKKKL